MGDSFRKTPVVPAKAGTQRRVRQKTLGPAFAGKTIFRIDASRTFVMPRKCHDPTNLLVLMSDEHNPKFLGAAGHPFIATPNLDALAARGTRFTSAYTTCPICVPARAGFAVGRYVHDIGYWDNADGYDGAIPSWHHALRDAGHRVVSIGKLHFRGRKGDDHGFSEEIVPMHIVDGIGDVKGLIRERIPKRKGGDKMARKAGPGESPYTVYDREIASRAQIWLHEEAPKWRDRPWVLFVSFVLPHFPLTAPPRWFYHYSQQDLPLPKLYAAEERPHHPFVDDYARTMDYDPHFASTADVKRAIAGYSGLVSSLDENVGNVLRALREAGLEPRRACCTPATTATTSARVDCGASPLCTRRVRACRCSSRARTSPRAAWCPLRCRTSTARRPSSRRRGGRRAWEVGRCPAHRCSQWPRAQRRHAR